MFKLRNWQSECRNKALDWFDQGEKTFLINAAPGAGKTIASCVIARELIAKAQIERVITIAPRAEVVNQWSIDFKMVTGRYMGKVTGSDFSLTDLEMDLCSTWHAVQGLQDAFQAVCRNKKTLVICDEHHHAAVEAAWGGSADSAFADSIYSIILTGTPVRSDGEETVWLAFDNQGIINHPDDGTYTLTYGEAVDLGYCIPATFHRHAGLFEVLLDDGEIIDVNSRSKAVLSSKLSRVSALDKALDFYQLACKPLYEKDDITPLKNGYQGTMIQWGIDKLSELRLRKPDAGGLIIAPTIEMAEYMAELLYIIDGERPVVVHSQMQNPAQKIAAFRNNNCKWLVSVAMVSEGVDIKRLRVLIYLPTAQTELAFRQALGRVVRTDGINDDTRAYCVMPDFEVFNRYARRVEEEMPVGKRKDPGPPKTKKCPVCETENVLNARICCECLHEFPRPSAPEFESCLSCGGLNPRGFLTCQHCGSPKQFSYKISLKEALREGAIVRGLDLTEAEVLDGEALARSLRQNVLKSGDKILIDVVKKLPEESWGRLKTLINLKQPTNTQDI